MPTTLDISAVAGPLHGRASVATNSPKVRILSTSSEGERFESRNFGFTFLDGERTTAHFMCAGTTILAGIKKAVDPSTKVVYSQNPSESFVKGGDFSYAVVVVGEKSYAEGFGDSTNLTLFFSGDETIKRVCHHVKCVVVIVSGRPVVIEPYVAGIHALVAAWWPGTEGAGVADVLFGDFGFSGKLARTWFRSVDQLPMNVGDRHYDPLYPFGYGLTTEPTSRI